MRFNQMLAEAAIKSCFGENNWLLDHQGWYGQCSKINPILKN